MYGGDSFGGAPYGATALYYLTVGVTREQSHFRFRNDDGDEDAATWKAAEDTDTSVAVLTPIRLRIQSDVTGDAPSEGLKLQARKVGDPTWIDVN